MSNSPHTIHGQRGYVVILGLVFKKILVSFGAKLDVSGPVILVE